MIQGLEHRDGACQAPPHFSSACKKHSNVVYDCSLPAARLAHSYQRALESYTIRPRLKIFSTIHNPSTSVSCPHARTLARSQLIWHLQILSLIQSPSPDPERVEIDTRPCPYIAEPTKLHRSALRKVELRSQVHSARRKLPLLPAQ